MAQKITLNELKRLVKQVINESYQTDLPDFREGELGVMYIIMDDGSEIAVHHDEDVFNEDKSELGGLNPTSHYDSIFISEDGKYKAVFDVSCRSGRECEITDIISFEKIDGDFGDESLDELYESEGNDSDLEAEYENFYQLFKEYKEAKQKFEDIQKKYKIMEDFFREELDDNKDKVIRIKNLIVKIKARSYERTDYKYSMIAGELYNKVNRQMRDMIDELMSAIKTETKIKATLDIRYDDENLTEIDMFGGAKNTMRKIISKLANFFSIKNRKLDSLIVDLEKLAY